MYIDDGGAILQLNLGYNGPLFILSFRSQRKVTRVGFANRQHNCFRYITDLWTEKKLINNQIITGWRVHVI